MPCRYSTYNISKQNTSEPIANNRTNPYSAQMTTTQNPSNSPASTTLSPQDQALIELLDAERFNLRALLNKSNPIHPCQRSLITLTAWSTQPHIDAALETIMDSHRALAAKADAQAHIVARESLTHALAIAASMIPHFDTCPDDPEHAEAFAKRAESLIRETRLIARTLLKLAPPQKSRRAASDHVDTTDTESDSPAHTDSTSSHHPEDGPNAHAATPSASSTAAPRATRLNRNSRKPVFSPAEVAEILSALLDHEHNLTSRQRSNATTSSTPSLASSMGNAVPSDTSIPESTTNSDKLTDTSFE